MARVSPYLAGACIEDVNHEIYGGIHCQMIFGESFEEEPMEIHPELDPAFVGLQGSISCIAEREHLRDSPEIRSWQPVRTGTAHGILRATHQVARRGQRSQLVELTDGEGSVGIENRGLNRWGMYFQAGKSYEGLLVVMATVPGAPEGGMLETRVALESGDGGTVYAEARLGVPANRAWQTVPFMPTIMPILRAMAARDPAVTPVLGAGLWDSGGRIDWRRGDYIRGVVEAVRGMRVLWDVHVGGDDPMDAHAAEGFMQRLRSLIDEIDPRNQIGLCVLEENGGRHDVQRALGHAHMIMSFERQGLVQIDTPANCQTWRQNDNAWDQGQLFFTPSRVWGMPPYHAQQMLARHYLPVCVAAAAEVEDPLLDATATRDEEDAVRCVKLLNLRDGSGAFCIAFDDSWRGGTAEVTLLSGPLDGENTPDEPQRIAPAAGSGAWSEAGYRLDVPAHGFAAVLFRR